ncbi:MAG: phosphonate metabolism protein/1,5-bisphosphokinase (PRPP-forming) PhnN [Pseudomonadota bacterium]
MSGRFIAVVGPSGVGKDSVMRALAAEEPRLHLTRRIITRPADAGGENHRAVTVAEFEKLRAEGAFALAWSAHGHAYAIPASVDHVLGNGQDLLANLSRGALVEARARFRRVEVLWLSARAEVLAARLAERGRESREQIAGRLARNVEAKRDAGAIALDNSGCLAHTVARARAALYPDMARDG